MSRDTIDNQPVLLYLHLPKAGGRTLEAWLYEQLYTPAADLPETRHFNGGVYHYPAGYIAQPREERIRQAYHTIQRPELRAVLGHFYFGLHSWLTRPYIYITLLRDPVDRIRSLFSFHRLVQTRYGSHEGICLPDEMDIHQFVQSPPYLEVDNGQTRRISGLDAPMGHCTEQMLEQACRNLNERFAVVGTTERFDELVVLLRRFFDWPERLYYPTNVTTGNDEGTALTSETCELIRSYNALDQRLYRHVEHLLDHHIQKVGVGFSKELQGFRDRKQAWYEQVGGWHMPERLR